MTGEDHYTIPAGTPFAFALRQIIVDAVAGAMDDEEVKSALEPIREFLNTGE